jgi:hypothetical protein
MPFGLDMLKYPSRLGKSWNKEEDTQLLKEIKEEISIETIAEKHQRTVGGITSHLKLIAVRSYTIDKEPIEIISKETGLTVDEIMYEIRKKETVEKKKDKDKPVTTPSQVTLADIMKELKDIRRILESS